MVQKYIEEHVKPQIEYFRLQAAKYKLLSQGLQLATVVSAALVLLLVNIDLGASLNPWKSLVISLSALVTLAATAYLNIANPAAAWMQHRSTAEALRAELYRFMLDIPDRDQAAVEDPQEVLARLQAFAQAVEGIIAANTYAFVQRDLEAALPNTKERPKEAEETAERYRGGAPGGGSMTGPTTASGGVAVPEFKPPPPEEQFGYAPRAPQPAAPKAPPPMSIPQPAPPPVPAQPAIPQQQEAEPPLDDLLELDEAAPEPAPEPSSAPIQFSSYYPKEVKPQDWQPLIAYIFRETAAADAAADAAQQLGEKIAAYRALSEDSNAPIAEGATVTATPTLPGFQFNPPSVAVGFYEDWHRFDFKLRAHDAPLNAAANGQITFTVEGLIVADIPLSIFVTEQPAASAPPVTTTRKPYDAIFISYSRRDKQIVERVERAYKALGMDILRDMISLRSGEDWNEGLLALIDRADIFQLFWSNTSAASDHVRAEWEYALKLVGDKQKPDNFIRPVYWESPMPTVPGPLRHLHFTPQPELAN